MSGNCKSKGNYHGLINHGRTCYLNSVLQVLFMTRGFREAVNRFVDDNPNADRIDPQLKELFDQILIKQTDTGNILKALHIDKVFEQQDAAEYLERILRWTSLSAANIFHGQMAHRTTCSDCGRETDTAGPFWHLPLELANSWSGHYSVENAIEEFFKPSDFSGGNQMYCDGCNTKANSTSKYVINSHPGVLILLLKRFDFSHQSMSYFRVKRDVDVPYTLKIPENRTYELYAAVLHSGDLRGGHYTAAIKPQDDKRWFSFDDTRVAPFYKSLFSNKNVAKLSGAYLLFYRMKDSGPEGSKDERPNEEHPATKDADANPANTDKERSTQVKAKRKGCCFHGHQGSVTAGESEQKKPKDNRRPTGENGSGNKNSREKIEKNRSKRDKNQEFDQSELDLQHSQRSFVTESGCDEGVADQELRNTEQNISGTQKTQKDTPNTDNKNQKSDEGPTAERRKEDKKETFQANTSQGLQGAAEGGHSSDNVKIITSKQIINRNGKPVIVKFIDTEENISNSSKGKTKYNEGNNCNRNTAKGCLPTSSGVDHSGPPQSGSRLKDYPGVDLDTPDPKPTQKKEYRYSTCL